jgi:hypothetical protein
MSQAKVGGFYRVKWVLTRFSLGMGQVLSQLFGLLMTRYGDFGIGATTIGIIGSLP